MDQAAAEIRGKRLAWISARCFFFPSTAVSISLLGIHTLEKILSPKGKVMSSCYLTLSGLPPNPCSQAFSPSSSLYFLAEACPEMRALLRAAGRGCPCPAFCSTVFAITSLLFCTSRSCQTKCTDGSQTKGRAEAGVSTVAQTMSPISPHSIARCPPCQAKTKLWKQCHESSGHQQHPRLFVQPQGPSCPSVSSLYLPGMEQCPLG